MTGSSRIAASALLCSLLAVLGACGGSSPELEAPQASAPAPVAASAQAVLEQYRQGFEVRSIEALRPLYSASPTLVRVWQGRRVDGWDAVERDLLLMFQRAQSVKLRVAASQVMMLGDDGALITANLTRSVGDGVTTVQVEGVLTLAVRREGERWLIVGEHFSHAPRSPGG
ncbi:YybH family protein [Haliangium ochraceum]|uniref:SnoaL-like domain-containing protein n=1 Tax=Haliangium ochraceum (strain DSM 14365 / JCM 11303 / SMP-2) TaxID=502025 RepID=D0LHW4_HALO1|nr:nuclear transport factor 2 family protein [Haliangium ochraceum]ACY14793.1 hypothetical protein Hoch_2250 [Haliangium ochraceum DSM 14365]